MTRTFTGGRFAIFIEGVDAGWVYSAEGGQPFAEVVTEKLSQEHTIRKHIAGVKYEDITITCGTGMSKAFWEHLANSFTDEFRRIDGTIIYADYDGKVRKTLDFHTAAITEIGFPALDAASKDAAKLTLKLTPEWTYTKFARGGESIAGRYPTGKGQQKKWSPANFRLRIDGLEKACAKVNKIEALSVKQKLTQNNTGEYRDYSVEPAGLEIPNLVITLPDSHAKQFYDWRKDFIIDGNCGEDQEKTGTLEFLSNDLQHVLFTVDMYHIGLFKMTPDKVEGHTDNISRVKVEMYVERMKFNYHSGATWA
jgi:hypothetical protein